MLFRLPALLSRITTFATNQSIPCLSNQSLRGVIGFERLMSTPFVTQIRGFKDKDVLKLRCSDCYFTVVDDRWWVLCDKHPRHKQREKVEDIRKNWIVTHVTRTGKPFKKHYQYPGHDL